MTENRTRKAVSELPKGYRQILHIDLQKDKKLVVLVNVLAVIIALAFAIPMHYYVSIDSLFDMSQGIWAWALRYGVLLVLMVAYMVLHELVHGVAMKLCGTKKVKYGFTGLYAYAGSEDYYDKKSYIFIAMAPILLWGIVIGIINAFVPTSWFWVVYFIQLINLSGAAGDLYITIKFSRLPKDILICDRGVGMKVYSKEYHD